MTQPFHLMAKPASYHCNLACDYCFYLDNPTVNGIQSASAKTPRQLKMSDDVLEAYVKQYISTSPDGEVNFTWQGGEPTLAGREFFQRALDFQRRYADGKTVTNSLQTNGVLIDENWAEFLAANRFLVGVSLDGPEHLHDHFRRARRGHSRFQHTVNAIKRLQKHNADYNILTTVNAKNALEPLAVYEFLTAELGAAFLQFIPIVETDPASPDRLAPWSVSAGDYGNFITTIFDRWVRRDVGKVFVQLFDNLLGCWLNVPPALCTLQEQCGYAWVIEQNGDIFLCDHFVTPAHRLGNVTQNSLIDMLKKPDAQRFSRQKTQLSERCKQCDYRFACHGGCPKQRISLAAGQAHNVLCDGFLQIFRRLDPYLRYMARCIQHRTSPVQVMNVADKIAAQQAKRDIAREPAI